MTLEQIFSVLWKAGAVAEAVALAVFIYRRLYRTFPVFCVFLAWSLVSDVGASYAKSLLDTNGFFHFYLIEMTIDSLLEFGVLVELSLSVLRPFRNTLPRGAIVAVGIIIGLLCAAIWPFTKSPGFSGFTLESRLLIHLQQTFGILRILFFLILAGCSQLLSIGWRDRELQIATGLGIYSMASVAVSVIHTAQSAGPQYHLLDELAAVSYLCSLIYWIYSFAQADAARREFAPQMQSFLLSVAGTARSTRMALSNSAAPRDPDHRP